MMTPSVVAYIRTPTDEEMTHIRGLWKALKQAPLPTSTDVGVELKAYLAHAVRMVGIVACLHPDGTSAIPGPFPLRVTEDGVTRIHDAVRLWTAILSLWTGPTL